MKRRFISLLLALSMILTLLPVHAFAVDTDNPFRDVKQGDWCYDAVQYVRVNGFFNGTTAATFSPNDTMTRGMFVTVLGRIAGVDTARYQGKPAFSDVPENAYFAPYVAWASQYGITTGTGDGKFSPYAPINRQQMAVFFVRYFEAFGVDYETGANITTTPADIERVAPYARDAVLKLWRTGLLNGDGVNFNPAGNATRAQTATVCYRADRAVETWYREPGVASGRVKLDPATGRPYGEQAGSHETRPTETKPSGGNHGGGSGGSSGGPGGSGGGTKPVSPPSGSYSVSFYDGGRLIESFIVKKGEPLGKLPAVSKSSKAGAVLEGYYTDPDFTTPFYAENPVNSNLTVYARYADMDSLETLTIDSFARMEEGPDVSFIIRRVSGGVSPKNAVTLVVKDGSAPVTIRVRDNGDGTYTVYAPDGFNRGCSYELNLAEGWAFVNEDRPEADTIRTAAFSIHMDEVEDLKMNRNIRYIQDTDNIYYYTSGGIVPELASNADLSRGGSFNYGSAADLREDDILCIYVGGKPDSNDSVRTEEAVYVKVSDTDGNQVYFESLDESDRMRLYEVPDNFPIQVDVLPSGNSGTVDIGRLDTALYAQMADAGQGTLEHAKAAVNAGDFVSLYVNADDIVSEEDVYFGEIISYDEVNGTILFRHCTAEDIEESSNLYKGVDIENTDFINPQEQAYIERVVQSQVDRSGFGEEAAYLLARMVTMTDGFRSSMGIQDFYAEDENGDPIPYEELAAYADIMELDDDEDDGVEVKVRVVLDKNKLHFGSKGVQLAVEVSAKFKVDGKDDGTIHFDLSATFVQEVAVDPKVKGELVYKKILKVIPVPTGVQVNAIVDVKSYTAMSLKADIYTVAPEDQSLWEKFKGFAKDPSALGDIPGIPGSVTQGLKTVGDAIDKIEETKAKIDKGLEDAGKLKSDLSDLWTVVETFSRDGLTRESYEDACETLGQTNVAGELMDMLHIAQDEISAEYVNGLGELMDKYSEMLERETDWVQLVDQRMFDTHTPPNFGIMVGFTGSFVVRADVNIALGSNLEYEVGKRYNFWFRVGLFKPTSGSSTMDLIDEHFAFQFYVMGKLGIKTGVRMKIYAAIGSVDAISVGLTTELGPYVKLWGFFIYDYSKYRPANSQNWARKEQMAGALYVEFGLYLMVGLEAKALFLEFDKDFVDEEFPLLDAGNKLYYYDAAYEPLDDEDEIVVYNNGSAALQEGCAVSMLLPEDTYALKCMDLTTGKQSTRSLDFDNYIFKVSNPNFRVDNVGGKPVISVISIPQNVRLMQCDLTITYKHGKLAFSTFDMSATVHLAWTNMTASEYQQVYTATVTVPDGEGGREAVWTKRVRKGTPFDLPTEEEIRSLLSWSDAKYTAGNGYGSQPIEGVTLIENTQYNYDLGYQNYSLTVTGIEGGSGGSRTFTAKYGEPFDFSYLLKTGAEIPGVRYTRFAGLTLNGENLDLYRPLTGSFAESVRSGANAVARAEYVDDSVTATFTFTGLDHPDIEAVLRSGEEPNSREAVMAAQNAGLVAAFYPAVGVIENDTVYEVVCGKPSGSDPNPDPDPDPDPDPEPPAAEAVITFEANGGSAVEPMTLLPGGVFGTLPATARTGYTFGGWFTDNGTFLNQVTANTVIRADMTLYAKWTPLSVTVTFNTNGGLNLTESTKTAAYGQAYGALPTPERSGYGFRGWWTAADDTGTQVTASTTVNTTEAHTLYAHWVELKVIPSTVFDFGTQETATYDKSGHTATYAFNPDNLTDCPEESSFTISYTRVSDPFIGENLDAGEAATMAGIYNVHITRDADGTYAKFDQNYTDVLVIERAIRDLSGITDDDIGMIGSPGLTYQNVGLTNACKNRIDLDDSSNQLYYEYRVQVGSSVYAYKNHEVESGLIYDLAPGGTYTILGVKITGDVNYEDAESGTLSKTFSTKAAPTMSFKEYAEANSTTTGALAANWIKSCGADADTYTISGWLDLLCFAAAVNLGNENIKGKTIKLTADIDLTQANGGNGIAWMPIGVYRAPVVGQGYSVPFWGTFDGGGHTISGLYASGLYSGLFGCVNSSAVIQNLTLDDCSFPDSTGGIVAHSVNITDVFTVRNCTSNARIDSDFSAAGAESYRLVSGLLTGAKKEGCTARPYPEKVS